jgi:SAM-dependent methyltransferase
VAELSPSANAAQAQRWNGASGLYWIKHRERHLAEQQHLTPHLFRATRIRPGERVLDVGCGCGSTTVTAARAVAGSREDVGDGYAVGLDLSAPMLGVARQLATRSDVRHVRFVRGDAQACPLQRNSFDVVISNFGVMFFENPDAAFASLAATVRQGGRLAFLCWQDDTQNDVFAIPLRAFAAHAKSPGPSADGLFVNPRRTTELLSGAGWKEIRISAITEPAWIGDDVDDVMDYVRGMPMICGLTDGLDQAVTERVLAEVAGQYAARQRPDGVWVRAAAWLVTARRT